MKRIIIISFPEKNLQKLAVLSVEQESPYELVELVREDFGNLAEEENNHFANHLLSDIIPIHNLSGIRDLSQVAQMQEKIVKGEQIVESGGLPNIKLVVAPNKKLLIFDGSHTLLVYINEGKKNLSEVPFLVIGGEDFTPITTAEISYFFPEKSLDLVKENWFSYVVNWQAKSELRLERRDVRTMGELIAQFRERDKGTVEE